MSKRGAEECDEHHLSFHEETGSDGTPFKVGCDCFDHARNIDWIQCTDCDIWFCVKAVKDEYDLNPEQLEFLLDDDHLFKCRDHEVLELDLKKAIQDSLENKINIPYNLRKRSKPCPELQIIESADDEADDDDDIFVDDQGDDDEEDDDDILFDFTDEIETKEQLLTVDTNGATKQDDDDNSDEDILDEMIRANVDLNNIITKAVPKKIAPKKNAPKKKATKKKITRKKATKKKVPTKKKVTKKKVPTKKKGTGKSKRKDKPLTTRSMYIYCIGGLSNLNVNSLRIFFVFCLFCFFLDMQNKWI